MTDTYLSIAGGSTSIYKEKGSKFYGFAQPVDSREKFEEFLDQVKSQHHKARHHCWAYIVHPKQPEERSQDDGEPSGSAGLPILNQLKSFELMNVGVIVVRYFGGTKLGIPGLIRSYKTAAEQAISAAAIVECKILDEFRISFQYVIMNEVMEVLKWEGVFELRKVLTADPCVDIGLPPSRRTEILHNISKVLRGLPINYDIEAVMKGESFQITEVK